MRAGLLLERVLRSSVSLESENGLRIGSLIFVHSGIAKSIELFGGVAWLVPTLALEVLSQILVIEYASVASEDLVSRDIEFPITQRGEFCLGVVAAVAFGKQM